MESQLLSLNKITNNYNTNNTCYRTTNTLLVFSFVSTIKVGRVAYSVYRLATGWTVWGSNTGEGEIFRSCSDRPWGPPSLLYNGYRVFPGGKEWPGSDSDTSPLLVPRSWKGRATPLLPIWAVRPVQSLSTCIRVHFTLYFNIITGFRW